jgi:hypothetical protein
MLLTVADEVDYRWRFPITDEELARRPAARLDA